MTLKFFHKTKENKQTTTKKQKQKQPKKKKKKKKKKKRKKNKQTLHFLVHRLSVVTECRVLIKMTILAF